MFQVKIYISDFNTERHDRERTQTEKDILQEEVNNLKEELIHSRNEVGAVPLTNVQGGGGGGGLGLWRMFWSWRKNLKKLW